MTITVRAATFHENSQKVMEAQDSRWTKRVTCDTSVTVHGKIPLMHSWYKTRSHLSELTTGFNNTVNRDGYEAVAEMFARNSCKMILPGMDLSDKHRPQESLSSPESILAQIRTVCRKHGVEISGQNSMVSKAPHRFEQIKKNISASQKQPRNYYCHLEQRVGVGTITERAWKRWSGHTKGPRWPDSIGKRGKYSSTL
ncbi:hypothetical protein NC653_025182 [Populus alba x Populus x berolinensis]|uniref:Beta-amylase n=1 Tax=Populus alba x Populus x berolinensis TaxID=444605 RepID=A0AAD6Q7R3_9ROSI|nr:hypothetical protein NC653_025182 [Populus alba x Populus x berolinensis]